MGLYISLSTPLFLYAALRVLVRFKRCIVNALLHSLHIYIQYTYRTQELCEIRGGRPGLAVPDSPYGLCGRNATLNEHTYTHHHTLSLSENNNNSNSKNNNKTHVAHARTDTGTFYAFLTNVRIIIFICKVK